MIGPRQRGQSMVELAACMPVALALALGTAAVVRVADARSGLDAATASAVAAAARQPDPASAAGAASQAFAAGCADYGLAGATLSFDPGTLAPGAVLDATGTATVSLAFAAFPFLPESVHLSAHASAIAEPWRSR